VRVALAESDREAYRRRPNVRIRSGAKLKRGRVVNRENCGGPRRSKESTCPRAHAIEVLDVRELVTVAEVTTSVRDLPQSRYRSRQSRLTDRRHQLRWSSHSHPGFAHRSVDESATTSCARSVRRLVTRLVANARMSRVAGRPAPTGHNGQAEAALDSDEYRQATKRRNESCGKTAE